MAQPSPSGIHLSQAASGSNMRLSFRMASCGIILALGLIQYLSNRQFWLDESMLAINVRDLTWTELFLPLKLEQSAPIGLLLLSKACITVLGPSEMAFRLPVFVIFLASLRIIYKRNDIFSEASIVFIFLTSFFIYYSSEFKQYMFDCYAGIMMLAFVRDSNYRGAIVFLTVFLWFSHATMVLLPPVLLLYIIFERDKKVKDLVGGAFLFGSVILFYAFFVKGHPTRDYMISFHSRNMGILGANDLLAFLGFQFGAILSYTPIHFFLQTLRLLKLSIPISLIMCFIFCAGLTMAARRGDRHLILFLVGAFASHFTFAALNLYPMGLRFSLELMPMLAAIFTMATGILFPVIGRSAVFKGGLLLMGFVSVILFDIRTRLLPIQYYEKGEVRKMARYLERSGIRDVNIYQSDIYQYVFYAPGLKPRKIYQIQGGGGQPQGGVPLVCYEDEWRKSGFAQRVPDTIIPGVRSRVFFRTPDFSR